MAGMPDMEDQSNYATFFSAFNLIHASKA